MDATLMLAYMEVHSDEIVKKNESIEKIIVDIVEK